ncbi:hypothetical protein [Paractinoplanes aksuensis]|nr:hypothetical protein [Actinoplanes aksuensis]
MTCDIENERLVRPSDLRGHRARHSRPARTRRWIAALTGQKP